MHFIEVSGISFTPSLVPTLLFHVCSSYMTWIYSLHSDSGFQKDIINILPSQVQIDIIAGK